MFDSYWGQKTINVKIITDKLLLWAYSIVVERLHGMEEVGVRFSLGPPNDPNC